MDPATIIALVGLGVLILAHIATSAFFIGRLTQKVDDTKERMGASDSCAVQLAAMTERLAALVERFDRFEATAGR